MYYEKRPTRIKAFKWSRDFDRTDMPDWIPAHLVDFIESRIFIEDEFVHLNDGDYIIWSEYGGFDTVPGGRFKSLYEFVGD